jgi:pimeloyl-ACP methyl ester carboxylesterase
MLTARGIQLVVLGVVAALWLGACGGGSSAKPAGALSWKACGDGAQCARLSVPLNAAQPDGQRIDLALLRYPATGKRVGSLVINPGGPGAAGTSFLRDTGRSIVAPSVSAQYDLVAWDPRGTGTSFPVQCGDRLDYLFDGITYAPRTAAQRDALVQANQRFVAACKAGTGAALEFLGSRDTVLDMERIRVALGDPQLNFLGFSYGTYLGAQYATQHPDLVGRFVLDGAVNPALPVLTSATEQSVGFDKGLEAFFASCGKETTCTYAGTQSPTDAYRALQARVALQPIPAAFGKALGPSQFDIGVAAVLYGGSAGWKTLAQSLDAAKRGDGQPLFDAFSSYVDRQANGVYTTQYPAFLAIGCVDSPPIGTVDQTLEAARTVGVAAPYFGETSVNFGLPCSTWPVAPTSAPGPVSAPSADPILVVGTTGDPATPVAWAAALAKQLQSARLVTMPGEQHTAYGQGNTCVDATINAYLVSGRVPDATVVCPGS